MFKFQAATALILAQTGFPATLVVPLQASTFPPQSLATALAADNPKKVSIVLLWRSDCAPCLVELSRLPALQAAAGKAAIVTLALESAARARATAQLRGISTTSGYVTTISPRTVLASSDGGLAFLPKAVALSADGKVCDTHVGILGTDKVREWAARC